MTSDPARSGLHPFSHLKAGPTTSSSTSTAQPASSTLQPQSPTTPIRPRPAKNSSRDDQIDAASEKATVNLIRRVLCPQTGNYGGSTPQPLEELLPPLTSSNDVDRQLYALIAIIIREFVYSWYSKITSDQVLVNEVLQVIAHCTRALEQRLRQIDVAQVILDEIPALVETHIASYRLAKQQSNLSGLTPSTRVIYHSLHPHPGLSPVPDPSDTETIAQQGENEALYRQLLVHGTLAVLLPTEDLENVCMQTIVGDILADLIIGNGVDGKVSEGWFLWESVTKILDGVEQRISHDDGEQTAHEPRQNQLKKFGLLSTEEEFQNNHSTKAQSQISIWFWSILQYAYLTYVALRFIATGLLKTASTPPTNPLTSAHPTCHATEALSSPGSVTGKRPVLNYRICSMLSQLMDLPQRMPWLGGFLALVQYLILAGPGRLGDTDSVLDRFLHETIKNYVLTPTLLPNLLLASRTALFPSNARPIQGTSLNGINRTPVSAPHMSVSSPTPTKEGAPFNDATGKSNTSSGASVLMVEPVSSAAQDNQQRPSASEIAAIKRRCALSILSLVPQRVARSLFGIPTDATSTCIAGQEKYPNTNTNAITHDQKLQKELRPPASANNDTEEYLLAAIEGELLDLFADEYCNKHLIYSVIETVLAKLLPELSERSIGELMEDRGVSPVTS